MALVNCSADGEWYENTHTQARGDSYTYSGVKLTKYDVKTGSAFNLHLILTQFFWSHFTNNSGKGKLFC